MRYFVEGDRGKASRFYHNEGGVRRRARLKSVEAEGAPIRAVAERYSGAIKDYERVGFAEYINGFLDNEDGVFANS